MGTSGNANSQRYFLHLDGLRGLLAAYVLCHHFLFFLHDKPGAGPVLELLMRPFQYGHATVGFFIVISGFSLMLPVLGSQDGAVRGGVPGYLVRRARRILPTYYAALAFSLLVAGLTALIEEGGARTLDPRELSFAIILSHLFLVHTLVPGHAHAINTALWSVAVEWHIYFLFPLVLLPLWRRFGAIPLVVGAFAIGLSPQVFLAADHDILASCPWYVGLFALGMIAAAISMHPNHFLMRRTCHLIAALGGCVALYISLKYRFPTSASCLQWLKDAAAGLVACCLLLILARADSYRRAESAPPGLLLKGLESRPALFLGRMSYSLYATHGAVLVAFVCAAARMRLSPPASITLFGVVGIPTSLGIGYLFSLWFEAPFLKRSTGGTLRSLPEMGDVRGAMTRS